MSDPRPRPKGWAKAIFDAPKWLYRHDLGWVVGKRFLALTHIGRRSGFERQTVLEVVKYDPETGESIVASAFGPTADWYRNVQTRPAVRIQTGRFEYRPEQRFLDAGEARTVALEFCEAHPLEARGALRVMDAIGAVPSGSFDNPVDLLASFPMVAFRPKT